MRNQHEPVNAPAKWTGDERAFAQRIEKLFDEVYRRLGYVQALINGEEEYILPTASAETKGGVKIGSGLTMDEETLNADDPPVTSVNGQTGDVSISIPTVPTNVSDFVNDAGYLTSVPVATANDVGGVKVGDGLSITDGTLSVIEEEQTATLLWQNSAQTTAFTPQDISVDLTNYSGVIVEYSPYTTYPTPIKSRAIAIGDGDPLMSAGVMEGYYGGRFCTVMRDKVKFWCGQNHATGATNNISIPLAIYGINGGVYTPKKPAQNCIYLVKSFDPYGGVIKNFKASKTVGNADALFCEWAYRIGGVGFALQPSTSSSSTLIAISDESFDATAGSTLEIDVAYHGYSGYNWIGLIKSSDIPSGFPNYRPASTTALQNLFTVYSGLSVSDNTFTRTTVTMTASTAGTYHLGYCKANQNGGIDMGTYTILEARLFAS